MTVDELMLRLHRDYLENTSLIGDDTPPLAYAPFIRAISLLVTGDERDEQGVLDRYLIYVRMCRRQRRAVDLAHFMAACILGNMFLDSRTRERIAEVCGMPKMPMVMN